MALDTEAAQSAITTHIATPLGVSLERAAFGIHDVISEDVARAFRIVKGIKTFFIHFLVFKFLKTNSEFPELINQLN